MFGSLKHLRIFVRIRNKRLDTMTTITEQNGFTIQFNGKATYFLSNEFDCIGYYDTERKALNALKRTLKYAGII